MNKDELARLVQEKMFDSNGRGKRRVFVKNGYPVYFSDLYEGDHAIQIGFEGEDGVFHEFVQDLGKKYPWK